MSTDTAVIQSNIDTPNDQTPSNKVKDRSEVTITVNIQHGVSIVFAFSDIAEYQMMLKPTLESIHSKLLADIKEEESRKCEEEFLRKHPESERFLRMSDTSGKYVLKGDERKKHMAEMRAEILATAHQYPEGFQPATLRSEMYGE